MVTFHFIKIPRRFLILCLCVGVVVWLGFSGRFQRQTALPASVALPPAETLVEARQGEPAPDFTLTDLEGKAHSLAAYRGRPVILYFWASWCPYCTNEMPQLNRVRAAYQDAGLEILAVNILEQAAKVRSVSRSLGIEYPVLLDEAGVVTRTFAVRATPTYVLIDREGVFRDVIVGSPREGVLKAKLEPLLARPQEEPPTL